MFKIALDAGHGLHTSGKQTPDGIKEWTLNDAVRDRVINYLKDYNVFILNTDNNEGEVDEPLSLRLSRYKEAGVSAFVSFHHNALKGEWNNATGVEVYIDKNPTESDLKLAQAIYSRMVEYTGLKPRGIKRANFTVINQNSIPAVLCEGGFMDGNEDYKYITSEEGQDAYARAVAEGLIEFLGLKKKSSTTQRNFVDVKGHYAEKEINEICEMGIVSGVDTTHYMPDKEATRGEVAIIARNIIRYITGE